MLSCIIQTKSHVEDFWNVPCGLGGILRMKLRTASGNTDLTLKMEALILLIMTS